MNSQDELTRALARRNPVPEQDVRAVTGGGLVDMSRSWTGAERLAPTDGDGPEVTQLTSRRADLWRRGGVTVLVAASVASLVAASVMVTGGLQDVRDRVAVAAMPDFPSPDRAAEAAEYDSWVQTVVRCLSEQYSPWVTAVAGGYSYNGGGRLASVPANTSVGLDDSACRDAAGPQPVGAPMTPEETRVYLDALRGTGRCLQRLGFRVPGEPSLQDFYTDWQAELPGSPPWTPYLGVADADLPAATQECGLPSPAAPPRWASHAPAELDRSPDAPVVAGQQAAPVRYLTPDTLIQARVRCLTALGFPQVVFPDGEGFRPASASVPAEARDADAVCLDRYPLHPLYEGPLDRAQLGVLYDWYVEESAPCLRERGVPVEVAPPEDVFVEAYPDTWLPYRSLDLDDLSVTTVDGDTLEGGSAWDELQRACPQSPPTDVLFPTAGADR